MQDSVQTKLTMVRVYSNGNNFVKFFKLPIIEGKVVLPLTIYNRILDELNVKPGDTVSIGF